MERLLEGLWNPLLGGFVLCAGLLLLLGTGALPLRRLGRAGKGWSIGSPSGPAILLATSASLTSITAAVLAVTVAGPGALVWMWIAALLGMGLHFGEAKLARQAVSDGKPGLPRWASFGVIAVALLAGGLWQGSQAGVLLEASVGLPAAFGAATIAVLALAASRMPTWSTLAIRWLPILGLTVFAVLVGTMLLQDTLALQLAAGDAINEAFGLQSATAGTVGGALSVLIAHGMMHGVAAADLGIGAAATAGTHDEAALDPDDAGASVMVVPFLAIGVLSTLAGLAVAAAPPEAPLAGDRLYPLERTDTRGLRASQQVGQTIVLPKETEMKKGEQYAMMLRANPRGHNVAKLLASQNEVVLPAWAVSADVDTVSFRARDPERAKQPAWDIAVPCNRELFGGRGEAPQFVRLTPKDPQLDFSKLIAFYELAPEPYVNVGNFEFVGSVALANSPDEELGEHLAMFEYRGPDTPFNPRLHEFFRHQYAGPLANAEGEVPPMAFAAAAGFDAEIGTRVPAVLRADPRGIDIVRVNRVGELEAPPWKSLLELEEVVIRHADGPDKDIRVPVSARLDGERIRLDVLDARWEDMRKLSQDEALSGPFAVMQDVTLHLEVHSDLRLPPAATGRRSLVPVHDDRRPRGPQERDVYEPHPYELIAAGFSAPYQPRGVWALARRVQDQQPQWGGTMFALAVVMLGVSTTLGWSLLIAAPARRLFGRGADVLVPLAVCVLPAAGGLLAVSLTASLAQLAYAFALIPVLGLLIMQVAKIRQSSRS